MSRGDVWSMDKTEGGCEATHASTRFAWSRMIVMGNVVGMLLKSPA